MARKTVAELDRAVEGLQESLNTLEENVEKLQEDVRPVLATYKTLKRAIYGILSLMGVVLVERLIDNSKFFGIRRLRCLRKLWQGLKCTRNRVRYGKSGTCFY